MRIGKLDTHPAADAFPLLDGPDFVALLEDIEAHGQREPVITHARTGAIVDGRNRAKAAFELSREPDVVPMDFEDDGEVVDFVISRNLHRRHLTQSQRAMVAERMARISHGKRKGAKDLTQSEAGKLLHVSERSVRAARELHDSGRVDLVDKVERGEKTLSRAVREAKRDESAAKLRAKPTPPPEGPFDVLSMDPPWRYNKNAAMADVGERVGEVDYPDMSDAEVVAYCVDAMSRLAPDAVVLLWVTNAHMPVAVDIVRACGLEWKTLVTWDKGRPGAGDVAMGQTEHFVVATRGVPTKYTLPSTMLKAPRREHSRKPVEYYDLVDKHFPGSKLELFAREHREGWTCHGVDVDKFESKPVQRGLNMEAG